MYHCQNCGRVSAPGEPAYEWVLEIRQQHYPLRVAADVIRRPSAKGTSRKKTVHDPGGIGWSIQRRIVVCGECWPQRILNEDQAGLIAAASAANLLYQTEAKRKLEEINSSKHPRRRDRDD